MSESTSLRPASAAGPAQREEPAEALWRLWRQGQRPLVETFLAAAGALSPAQLAAVLRVDQRERWQAGERVPAETYLERYPDVKAAPDSALDLVYNELLLREKQGERPTAEEYLRRFPQYADVLKPQIELHHAVLADSGLGGESVASGEDGLPSRESTLRAAASWEATAYPSVAGYEILGEMGRGGMGVVYRARQLALDRLVALKMLLGGAHADAEHQRRFQAEAEAIARLRHPNIVQVYDYGVSDGYAYLSLEFVEGGTLAQKAAGVPQSPRRAAQVVETLAAAMHHAHRQGLVHRDLKPANVLLTAEGVLKITDFGLAKQLGSDAAQTASGALLGTPTYMAPEQVEGERAAVGAATDVYALGVILYQLLTGRPPFQGDSALAVLEQVKTREPVPPGRLQPGTPRDLETICLKCLQKGPGQRYPTAAALAEDLRRFQAGEQIAARPIGVLERTWRWCRRNPRWAAMLATVAGLLLVIAIGASALSVWALKAEARVKVQLFESKLAEARSTSLSRRPGRRFKALAHLEEAKRLARELNLPPEKFHELRNATLLALTMADLYQLDEPDAPARASLARRAQMADLYQDPKGTWAGFPDGSTFVDFDDQLEVYARADKNGTCSIRRVDGDKELHRLPGPASESTWAVLSRDARFVAVRHADGVVQLWRLHGAEPEELWRVKNVFSCHFHPSSREVVLGHTDGAISRYDLTKGQRIGDLLPPNGLTREIVVALHPTEPLVAVASYYGKEVQVRDLGTGKLEKSLEMSQGAWSVAWHPQGHTLAVGGGEPTIRLFDRATFRHRRSFGPASRGSQLYFNHAGDRLVVGGWGDYVELFDVATGQMLLSILYAKPAGHLRFSADDCRLAGFVQGEQLGIWQVAAGREYRTLLRLLLPPNVDYVSAAIHPGGRLLAVQMTDGVGFWDLESGAELDFLPLVLPTLVHFEPDGALLLGDETGTYRWPVRAGPAGPGRTDCQSVLPIRLRIGPPRPLALPPSESPSQSADGKVLASRCRAVGVTQPWAGGWVLHADRPDTPLSLDAGTDIGWIAVSPDGRWAVTVKFKSRLAKLWDARTGRLQQELPGYANPEFSPDGRWLALGGDQGHLFAVNNETMACEAVRKLDNWGRFTPDSRLLVQTTNTHVLRLVEAFSGRELAQLDDPNLDVPGHLLFTPDGTRLLSVNSERIHLWDLRLLRQQLAERGLDWDAPPYPPAKASAEPLRLQFDCGDYDRLRKVQAVKNFDRAVQSAPHLGVRWFVRGKFHQQAGRYEEALADLRKAAELQPDSPSCCNHLARLYATGPEKIRNTCEAVALAERAVKLQPGEWSYHNTLGIAYYRAGRIDDAVAALEKSLAGRSPADQAFNLYFLAMCHCRSGDANKAKEYFDRAMAMQERSAASLTNEEAEELRRVCSEAQTLLAEKRALETGRHRRGSSSWQQPAGEAFPLGGIPPKGEFCCRRKPEPSSSIPRALDACRDAPPWAEFGPGSAVGNFTLSLGEGLVVGVNFWF